MAGRPVLKVELDDPAAGGTWPYDITAYVDLRTSEIMIERGRQDEFNDIEAGRLQMLLNNNDGRFTLGSTTGGYGGAVEDDRRLRVTETVTVGGVPTVSRRFTGYVDEWPTRWPDTFGRNCHAPITVMDRMARLNRRDSPSTLLTGEQLLDQPAALWELDEEAGSISAGDTSGNGAPALVVASNGPNPLVFGTPNGLPDGSTGVQFAALGQYLVAAVLLPQIYRSVEFVASRTGPSIFLYFGNIRIELTNTVQVTTSGTAVQSSAIDPGVPYHVLITITGTTLRLYLDGVLQGTALTVDSIGSPAVGLGQGIISALALYDSPLSATRVTAHASAAKTPSNDTSDQRIARLASYANISPTDLQLEPGQLSKTLPQVAAKLLDAMQEVAMAEGGPLFVNGDGMLVLQNRNRRTRNAAAAPVLTLGAGDYEDDLEFGGEKQYLFNDVTGTRPGGATQSYRDAVSVGKYEQYPASLSLVVTTDDEVLDRVNWQARVYSTPRSRISQVTIDLLTQTPAVQAAGLGLEIGAKVRLTGLPSQVGSATDQIVEGLVERQGRDKWTLTLNTVAAELFRAWIVEDPVYGSIQTNNPVSF